MCFAYQNPLVPRSASKPAFARNSSPSAPKLTNVSSYFNFDVRQKSVLMRFAGLFHHVLSFHPSHCKVAPYEQDYRRPWLRNNLVLFWLRAKPNLLDTTQQLQIRTLKHYSGLNFETIFDIITPSKHVVTS